MLWCISKVERPCNGKLCYHLRPGRGDHIHSLQPVADVEKQEGSISVYLNSLAVKAPLSTSVESLVVQLKVPVISSVETELIYTIP
jgi:hypothetical protein